MIVRRGCAGALLIAAVSIASAGGSNRPEPLRIVTAGESGWTIQYSGPPVPAGAIQIDGAPHLLYAGPVHPECAQPGMPALPVEILSLGIPFGTTVTAELVDAEFFQEENRRIAPVARRVGEHDSSASHEFRKDSRSYGIPSFLPSVPLAVDTPFVLRGQRIVTIRLAPVQYQPSTGALRSLRNGRIVVRLSGGTGAVRPHAPDPFFEPFFRSVLANADQAREWRVPVRQPETGTQDSSATWFQPGVAYAKAGIPADGWYRIPKATLAPLIGGASSLDGIAVMNRGRPVPHSVIGDSLLEFYGWRLRGDSAFINDLSDTNACWIRQGVPEDHRYVPAGPLPGGTDTLRTAVQLEHFEANRSLYVGTTEQEVISNSPVPGRGWVWDFFYPGTGITYPFVLDTVAGGGAGLLTVRMFSTTLHYSTPDHRARFWINDSLVGEAAFDGRSEGLTRLAVPPGVLRSGANVLRIVSVATASFPNQFYLDWFEVSRNRPLVARDGVLRFRAEPLPGVTQVFEVRGFESSAIDVFDLTGGRRLDGGTVMPPPGGGYAVLFADTLTASREYIVRAVGSGRTPPSISRRVFGDLRNDPRGADYLILTHRQFAREAADLAAHRERTNGVRAAAIDVEDIYDQFSFGNKDVRAIRSFLRFAAASWPVPRPSSVLFFGGASYDAKAYEPGDVKPDYVPAYGTPTGDNWFACFDETRPYLPSLYVGRLSVDNTVQAAAVVDKLKRYDALEPSTWNKRFLFITGGNSDPEQVSFDQISAHLASTYAEPAPVGGEILRVRKKTTTVIDGDSRESIRQMIADGLLYMNFLGHSGGRIWNVDVGNPAEFQNTGGEWPFVSSVSCGVASFASPFDNCLAEDFVFPEGRGAIGVWGSSSLGYAFIGSSLVENLMERAVQDTLRELGALTTAARLRLWQTYGTSPISIAHLNLTPLIGDPLTRLALPTLPDLAVKPAELIPDRPVSTAADTSLMWKAAVHNYGLVPADSIEVLATGTYGAAGPVPLLSRKIGPVHRSDTMRFGTTTFGRAGKHTVTLAVDPAARLREVRRSNNSAVVEAYVYATSVTAARPFDNAVAPPGARQLVITVPGGDARAAGGNGSLIAFFELDTVTSFTSPARLTSGPITPGSVSAAWTTPALPAGKSYFWRGRIDVGQAEGSWVTSSFSTSTESVPPPYQRWRQSTRDQFQRNERVRTVSTDSGLVLGSPAPIRLYARSLGARSTTDGDQFSAIRINDLTTLGYWWAVGYGTMVARVDPLTGLYTLRSFEVGYRTGDADSLAAFVEQTPVGHYMVFAIIIDGATRATERFYGAIESLGSTVIRQVRAGDAWTFIARKGGGTVPGLPAEHLSTTGIAIDSAEVPVRYGDGSTESLALPRASLWRAFGWESSGGDVRIILSGTRADGREDTLAASSGASGEVNLQSLDPGRVADLYRFVRPVASLSTTDALLSPRLNRWWVDLVPAADLAVGPVLLLLVDPPVADPALQITVTNIGGSKSDSAGCTVTLGNGSGGWTEISRRTIPPLPTDSAVHLSVNLPRGTIPPRAVFRVSLSPGAGRVDQVEGNNFAELTISLANPISGRIQILADETELADGDFLGYAPAITFRVPGRTGVVRRTLRGFLDGVEAGMVTLLPDSTLQGNGVDVLEIQPSLSRGEHLLEIRAVDEYRMGLPDSTVRILRVNVADEFRIHNLLNYPNPFSRGTEFTFTLSGARAPESGKISIYTVSGRRIRRIELVEPRIGFNRIAWDGRDDDGDEVANGTYLYRLEVHSGEDALGSGGKLVRIR